jgi:rhodanese-related sulfurtransferase
VRDKYKKLFFEMTLIVLLATVAGIIWNHRLLADIYSGKYAAAETSPEVSTAPGTTMVPAGLMQVKDLFDRKEAVFVDARESSTFSLGHIAQAASLPLADLDSSLPGFQKKVPYNSTLVLYCSGYGCHDSKDLGEKLLKKGYQQILIFEGGYPEWKDAGFPIEGANQ